MFSRHEGGLLAFNFLSGSTFSCSPDLLTLLGILDEWTSFDSVASSLPATPRDELRSNIDSLVAVAALTAEGSPLAEAEDEFQSSWSWGLPAALFHFSVQDKEYISLEKAEALQRAKLEECGQPPLYLKNDRQPERVRELPPAIGENDLLRLMARRRTTRTATGQPISQRQLSDFLFAGLGITGHTANCVGSLPLSMTPSGGARNPYEAYIYARSVEGLDQGFYHYSAFEHSLGRIPTEGAPRPSELMGGQEWTDDMPCVVFLCAFFERTMWKYADANAYRVVLIEAGHIGQNMMLAATHHGLSACPSAALNHAEIKKWLDLGNTSTRAPIYALTLSAAA